MQGDIHNINSGPGKGTKSPTGPMPRRLAAIVVGDISGYSRLMELDEEGTHARLRRLERELIEPSINEHYGRLVKKTGDGFIAIFDSPVEAVRCGIVIQQGTLGRNTSQPKHAWICYRIGINLGDVIIEEDDVYGDGVNIAARLEGIADPGQVYISGGIYEQIKHKLVCGYQSLGDRKIKNITDPVRVYRVLPDPAAFNKARKKRENFLILLFTAILFVIAGVAIRYYTSIDQQSSKVAAVKVPPLPQSLEEPKMPLPRVAMPPQREQPLAPPSAQAKPPTIIEIEMVALPGGTFAMGSNDDSSEKPIHQVSIKPFSIGKYPITVRQWNTCTESKACGFMALGREDAPVTNVSWSDAKQYIAWLADSSRKAYRLPTEAEWEYAARAGTQTKYWWGDQIQAGMANCKNCSDVTANEQPIKVGSFKVNPFGIYDMGGVDRSVGRRLWPQKLSRRSSRWFGVGRGRVWIARHPIRIVEE